jgi:hypothetical protein
MRGISMSKSPIASYQDLQVWQEGMNLGEICYLVTKAFPKEETYGMTKPHWGGV